MTDLAIPLSGVDALHAHFAEWVRFLDAKGIELEAQLAKLEASKKKKANGMEAAASASTPQKVFTLVTPASTVPAKINIPLNSVDWLDDGLGSTKEPVKPAPQATPQPADPLNTDEPSEPTNEPEEPVSDAGNSADDEYESKPTNASTIASRADNDEDEVLDWLKS